MQRGFSTLELMIAFALIATILSSTVVANTGLQYWRITARTAVEALNRAERTVSLLQVLSVNDFEMVSSTDRVTSNDTECNTGGICYGTTLTATSISSCVKNLSVEESWRIGLRYPTSTISLTTTLVHIPEIILLYSDCIVDEMKNSWLTATPTIVTSDTHSGQFSTGIDVLDGKMYVVASSSPQLRIYSASEENEEYPLLLGTSSVTTNRLNAIDVVRDMPTGRTYAYVVQHTISNQLVVVDVTDSAAPLIITTRNLFGVFSDGSFPQGWRITLYGDRAYVFSRETAGPELHIFNITNLQVPIEITTAARNVGRTVNDVVVHEQLFHGERHRYLFVAASAATRELEVFDVTYDIPVSVAVVDLPGSEDLSSLELIGNTLYAGRKNSSGPELYQFGVSSLLDGITTPIAMSEVAADVTTILGNGPLLILGTNKTNAQLQVWHADPNYWSTTTINASRATAVNFPRLAPLGLDGDGRSLFGISQSATQGEVVHIIKESL